MQEIIRKCDRETRGGRVCGERVPEDSPTSFTVNAVSYELDLCAKHYEEFMSVMEPYMIKAVPAKNRASSAVRSALKGKSKPGETFTTKDVRAWLQEQGREVSSSGRLSNDLIEEYKVAQGV